MNVCLKYQKMAVVLQDFDHRINHLTGDKTVNDIEDEIAKQTSTVMQKILNFHLQVRTHSFKNEALSRTLMME